MVTSILCHQVNVPADLKLVLIRTKETPFLCPFPASIFETSTEKIARALLEIVESLFAGHSHEPRALKMEHTHRACLKKDEKAIDRDIKSLYSFA